MSGSRHFSYLLLHKPFQVMSQFSPVAGKRTLADLLEVSKRIYPVGRLDYDSEGLLLLTDDTRLNQRLLHPSQHIEKEYWAQVEGVPGAEALRQLQQGVAISVDGKPHQTTPAKAILFPQEPMVYERVPPIRFRKSIPTSWIGLTISEGKNRQVRKMTAAVGLPTLRLIRYRFGHLTIEGLAPGEYRILSPSDVGRWLK